MSGRSDLSLRGIARSAVVGAGVGALVLGVLGRLLMRVIALATGTVAGFSHGGALEVIATGTLYGAAGGALLPLVPPRLGPWRGVVHAAGLFILIALVSDAARSAAGSVAFPGRILALLPFGALVLVYSVGLVRLTAANRRRHSGPRRSPIDPQQGNIE